MANYAPTKKETICLSRCGSFRRFNGMIEHFKNKTCPFCVGNGFDPEVNKVLFKNEHWTAWEVGAGLRPHETGLNLHLIIAPIRHRCSWQELNDDEKSSIWEMFVWADTTYEIPGGMLFMRFGDPDLSAATEVHASFQIKVPDLSKALSEPLAKSSGHVTSNLDRGARFLEIYNQGISPDQFENMVKKGTFDKTGNPLIWP